MKITLLKESFLEKINLASKFTSSKINSSTSLQGVCLIGEEGLINFYSTNLNSYYHTFIKYEGASKFKAVVEPRKIGEFLSLLSSGKIDIEIKDKQIIISQDKTVGEFPLFESAEFPFPPKIEVEKQKIKADFFKNNLPLVVFSSSSDETRPVLTGINFVSSGEDLQIVATDGFRLSLLNMKKQVSFPAVIVPAVFLTEVAKFLKSEKEISFSYSEEEKILVFYIGENELFTRLIEGDYPPFGKVIPSEKKTTVVLDRSELLRNVKLASIFARDFSSVVVLKTEKNNITVTPKNAGDKDVAFQEAVIQGEEVKIAFNYKFLIDFLNNATSKKIIIELLRSDAPAIFKIEGQDNFLHIIMPVRIQE